MKLVLELTADVETELVAESTRLGLPLSEYALRILTAGRTLTPAPHTGAELLAYWQNENLIGTRTDIDDAPAHARALREQSQRRPRT